ncbi:hypothetical protein MtrunA17_Chr7g0229061 [Medicago truncatula]|uniref:Uncharacterized protein n=1 Tax=Medicago truncatula TaxID=3880 RepID=A0A396GW88_MEDTR|nr:hypothetical protein MtrunA17_Chr7g0229061 [Medicago truncatula]
MYARGQNDVAFFTSIHTHFPVCCSSLKTTIPYRFVFAALPLKSILLLLSSCPKSISEFIHLMPKLISFSIVFTPKSICLQTL